MLIELSNNIKNKIPTGHLIQLSLFRECNVDIHGINLKTDLSIMFYVGSVYDIEIAWNLNISTIAESMALCILLKYSPNHVILKLFTNRDLLNTRILQICSMLNINRRFDLLTILTKMMKGKFVSTLYMDTLINYWKNKRGRKHICDILEVENVGPLLDLNILKNLSMEDKILYVIYNKKQNSKIRKIYLDKFVKQHLQDSLDKTLDDFGADYPLYKSTVSKYDLNTKIKDI